MQNQEIQYYLTEKNSADRLAYKGSRCFQPQSDEFGNIINIYNDVEYQTFYGFGGAITESAAVTFDKMSPETKNKIIESYFSTEKGNGYTFCRTHMNSCDFSVSNYSCDETPDDYSLSDFQIEREKKHIIPMIKMAMAYGPIKLFFSPWSPPSWMKSNHSMNHGGKLLPQYRKVWAEYYVKFIKMLQQQGINVWGLTVQNEPMASQTWDSCLVSAEEEKIFVADYLAPALESSGLGSIKIMIWDHNKENLYDRAKTIFADPKASDKIWGAGFHWYSGDHFDALDAFHRKWPDKKLIFTEGCVEGAPQPDNWSIGERYGHAIIGDLNHYTSAWCDWNLLLDMQGGPNHVGNYCNAPILADPESDHLTYESSYWYIGHFSRFIRPESVRIGLSKYSEELECTAFKNQDNTVAVVVMNRNEEQKQFNLRYKEKICPFTIPAHSIMTFVFSE